MQEFLFYFILPTKPQYQCVVCDTHTLFRPNYSVIIIGRIGQRAIRGEGRSEGLVINQLDSDEDLPSVINTHQAEVRLS